MSIRRREPVNVPVFDANVEASFMNCAQKRKEADDRTDRLDELHRGFEPQDGRGTSGCFWCRAADGHADGQQQNIKTTSWIGATPQT